MNIIVLAGAYNEYQQLLHDCGITVPEGRNKVFRYYTGPESVTGISLGYIVVLPGFRRRKDGDMHDFRSSTAMELTDGIIDLYYSEAYNAFTKYFKIGRLYAETA